MAVLLSCRNIGKRFGELVVLKDISLDIGAGDRIGLVGRNGAGKTTLARILFGALEYDQGSIIHARQDTKIGYLQQAESFAEASFNSLVSTDREESGEFLRLSSRLGIQKVSQWEDTRLARLSGGENTKLCLAAVWALKPNLLILDEPTNHLDLPGVEWLVEELRRFEGAVLLISHDRYFLDQTVTRIAEIDNGSLTLYKGNYTFYRTEKEQEYKSRLHSYQAEQKYQQHIEESIRQLQDWSGKAHRESRKKAARDGKKIGGKEYFRKKAKKRDQAVKSKIKKLEKLRLDGVEKPAEEPHIRFSLQACGKRGRRLLEVENIGKAYGNLLLFSDTSFYVNRGEKVGIYGPNGCGKTTLLKIFLSREAVDKGQVFLSPSARISYIGQNLPATGSLTAGETIKDWEKSDRDAALTLFARLEIDYDQLKKALSDLSPGERMKIEIARAILQDHDMLVLDEPTNHLDLYSRESLERSLLSYQGTILIVSHDRYLLNRVCDRMLVFNGRKVLRVEDNIESYLRKHNPGKGSAKQKATSADSDGAAEKLLFETRLSFLLGELSKYKPQDPEYLKLDREFKELIKRQPGH